MSERNVTRAATQMGVSQPAMSAALSRLRKRFSDPLFLRSADGLLPTPRARDLAEPISQALRQIEFTLVKSPEFVPDTASLTLKLGLSDYPAFVLLPSMLHVLEQQARGVSLHIHAFNNRDHAVDLLDAGAIDAAIGVPPTHADGRILTRPVLRDEFATILAIDHPAAKRGMSMKTYLELSHALVSPEGELYGMVDQALAQQGKKRRVALTLPQMFVVPAVVARTNMVATVLKRVALNSPAASQLKLFSPPVILPEVVFELIWHRRSDTHPAQKWVRELIAGHASSL